MRIDDGWRADCTDVDGVRGALVEGGIGDLSGAPAVVIGAGGTARPALVALADLGVGSVTVVARDAARARETLDCAEAVGLHVRHLTFDDARLGDVCAHSAALVSTVPAVGAAPWAEAIGRAPFVLDAIYDPWPTPLAQAVERAGGNRRRRSRDAPQPGIRPGGAVHRHAGAACGDGCRTRFLTSPTAR